MEWTQLAQGTDQSLALVNMVIKLQVQERQAISWPAKQLSVCHILVI
jgi:hypothetical protein